MIGHWA